MAEISLYLAETMETIKTMENLLLVEVGLLLASLTLLLVLLVARRRAIKRRALAEPARKSRLPVAEEATVPAAKREEAAVGSQPQPSVVKVVPAAVDPNWLPEDATLRRHYATQREAERLAITNPYPTDATLRRHYDSLRAIRLEKPAPMAAEPLPVTTRQAVADAVDPNWLPEDATLRRHYATQREAERMAITNPYPTDATLRRHYDSLRAIRLEKPARLAVEAEPVPVVAPQASKVSVPEDAALRRHFLSQLQNEVEARLAPRPSDSVLRRHYDNLVRACMEACLSGGRMA